MNAQPPSATILSRATAAVFAKGARRGSSPRHRLAWTSAALLLPAVLAAVLYAPAIGFELTNYDDDVYVSRNEAVRAGLSLRGAAWALGSFHAGYYIPVTWLSLMLDASLFRTWAGGYHLTNLLLHAANVLLFAFLLRRWTGQQTPSVMAACLLAVHPLHVESVAWVTERKDVLALFFLLFALHQYSSWLGRPTTRARSLFLGAFALSLLAKPMGVTLPLLLPLLDRWPFGRRVAFRRRLAELAPVIFLAAASAALTLRGHWLRHHLLIPLDDLPLDRRLPTAIVGFAWYLAKAVWPDALAVHYRLPPAGPPAAAVLLATALLAALCGASWLTRRKNPAVGFGVGWYMAALVPVSGLFQAGVQATADRFAYLPLAGVYASLSWVISRAHVPAKPVRWAAAVALAALAAVSAAQLSHWRDSGSLFTRALAVEPDNPVAHLSLSAFLLEQGRRAESEEHARLAAAAADPDNVENRFWLAMTLAKLGKSAAALAELNGVLAIRSDFVAAHYQKGLLLAIGGADSEARASLAEAARLDPGSGATHYNLGVVLLRLGRSAEGEGHLAEAERLGVRGP